MYTLIWRIQHALRLHRQLASGAVLLADGAIVGNMFGKLCPYGHRSTKVSINMMTFHDRPGDIDDIMWTRETRRLPSGQRSAVGYFIYVTEISPKVAQKGINIHGLFLSCKDGNGHRRGRMHLEHLKMHGPCRLCSRDTPENQMTDVS
jgi:hypothetical protein